ncbi:preprotein translocase subunit Sec61beta [Stetteria hydrogenophila]
MSKRQRRGGPMTAAGLISFYEEYEGAVRVSPTTVVLLASLFTLVVVVAHIVG